MALSKVHFVLVESLCDWVSLSSARNRCVEVATGLLLLGCQNGEWIEPKSMRYHGVIPPHPEIRVWSA